METNPTLPNHITRDSFVWFLLFIVPNRNLYIEVVFLVLVAVVYGFAMRREGHERTRTFTYVLLFIAWIIISAVLRSLALLKVGVRDFAEAARYVPALLFLGLRSRSSRASMVSYRNAAFAYATLDAAVSYMQYQGANYLGVLSIVERVYNSSDHVALSLGISRRALGLSNGPGDHAVTMFIMLLLLISSLYYSRRLLPVIQSIVGVCCALYAILVSQSRTVFIATMLTLAAVCIVTLLRGNKRHRLTSLIIFAVLALNASSLLGVARLRLNYLATILGNVSYSGFVSQVQHYSSTREGKWSRVVSSALEQPLLFATGHGKDYFGMTSGSLDSDYIYLLLVYGLPVAIMVLIVLGRLSLTVMVAVLRNKPTFDEFFMFFALFSGLLIGYSSSFFLDIKILCLFAAMAGHRPMPAEGGRTCSPDSAAVGDSRARLAGLRTVSRSRSGVERAIRRLLTTRSVRESTCRRLDHARIGPRHA